MPYQYTIYNPPLEKTKEKTINFEDLMRKKGIYYEVNGEKGFLSGRETDCICLIAKGLTTKEIAKALSISSRTVEDYIIKIRYKLNVNLRSDILKQVMSHKWNRFIVLET